MAVNSMAEIRDMVPRLAAQYGAKRVYLFGSYARGDTASGSDIDLHTLPGLFSVCGQLCGQNASRLRLVPFRTSSGWEAFSFQVSCVVPLNVVKDQTVSKLMYEGGRMPGAACVL